MIQNRTEEVKEVNIRGVVVKGKAILAGTLTHENRYFQFSRARRVYIPPAHYLDLRQTRVQTRKISYRRKKEKSSEERAVIKLGLIIRVRDMKDCKIEESKRNVTLKGQDSSSRPLKTKLRFKAEKLVGHCFKSLEEDNPVDRSKRSCHISTLKMYILQ